MKTFLVVLGLVLGWIPFVLGVTTILPGGDVATESLQGAAYLAYVLLALILIRRSRGGARKPD
jgi:hypothetical protein